MPPPATSPRIMWRSATGVPSRSQSASSAHACPRFARCSVWSSPRFSVLRSKSPTTPISRVQTRSLCQVRTNFLRRPPLSRQSESRRSSPSGQNVETTRPSSSSTTHHSGMNTHHHAHHPTESWPRHMNLCRWFDSCSFVFLATYHYGSRLEGESPRKSTSVNVIIDIMSVILRYHIVD